MLVVGGMIGLGKTSVAELLGKHFNSKVFYESVEDNPILPLFYTATQKDIETKRYAFLLQLHFLNTRFKSIWEAGKAQKNVLDRSIYEDWYFAKINNELGRISDLEFRTYEDLFHNMVHILGERSDKELMVYLKGSFETVINRIMKRGRSYELDESLVTYYRKLWESYDECVLRHYSNERLLVIDMDCYDVVGNPEDAKLLIKLVEEKWQIMSNR